MKYNLKFSTITKNGLVFFLVDVMVELSPGMSVQVTVGAREEVGKTKMGALEKEMRKALSALIFCKDVFDTSNTSRHPEMMLAEDGKANNKLAKQEKKKHWTRLA